MHRTSEHKNVDKQSSNPADFLDQAIPKYTRLTRIAQSLIENILNHEAIEFLSVSGRTKTRESASEKVNRKSYTNPETQITDLTGIRIITYLDHQVRKISDIISRTFEIDKENSMDRSQILGDDRVGYRSVHFVCSLGTRREGMREYLGLCDLKFEIQVRTVLQHAWAELTHDRSYKISGVLPQNLQRKLNLYAGMLEIADAAFDEIALAVDSYARDLQQHPEADLLQESVNSISLAEFTKKLQRDKELKLMETTDDTIIIGELEKFGISKIGDLQSIIDDAVIRFYKTEGIFSSITGFLRTSMLYHDVKKYLKIEPPWTALPQRMFNLVASKYGEKETRDLLEEHGKATSES